MFKELNTMEHFFHEPRREFSVRETARILKIAPATASKDLVELADRGILKVRDERLAKLYSANIENESYRDLKKYYTIRKLKDSGFLQELNFFYHNPTVILFGSAAAGSDTESSDVDVIVISERSDSMPDRAAFEKKFGRRLQLFVVQQLSQMAKQHLITQIMNGIVLQGALQWK